MTLGEHPYITFAREIYTWLIPVMVIVLLVAVIGNGLIVSSAPWLGRTVSPYHRLCLSLAAADMWAASLLIAGLMVNSYIPVVMRIPKQTECIAAALEVFRISGMLTSNLHILALATNQFVGIMFPLRYKYMVTTKLLRRLIISMWVVPLIFVGSWFVLIPDDGFRNKTCRQKFYSRLPFRASVFVFFIVPLLATFTIYAIIARNLLAAKHEMRTNLMRRSVRRECRKRVNGRLKLVCTALCILSTFTLSWGVCVLYFLLVCVEGCPFIYMKSVSFYSGFLFSSTVNFLVALKLLLNPLIYALRMSHIRTSVVACLKAGLHILDGRAWADVDFKSTGDSVSAGKARQETSRKPSQSLKLVSSHQKSTVRLKSESSDFGEQSRLLCRSYLSQNRYLK